MQTINLFLTNFTKYILLIALLIISPVFAKSNIGSPITQLPTINIEKTFFSILGGNPRKAVFLKSGSGRPTETIEAKQGDCLDPSSPYTLDIFNYSGSAYTNVNITVEFYEIIGSGALGIGTSINLGTTNIPTSVGVSYTFPLPTFVNTTHNIEMRILVKDQIVDITHYNVCTEN